MEVTRYDKQVSGLVLAVGLVSLVLPSFVLSSPEVSHWIVWIVMRWPKLQSDMAAIGEYDFVLPERYAVSGILAVGVFATATVIRVWSEFQKQEFPRPFPKYVRKSNLFLIPLLMLLILYFGLIDTWMAVSDARAARGVYGTVFCVFWMPLTLAAVSVGFQRLAETYRAYKTGLI